MAEEPLIAVFVDFENLAIGVRDMKAGRFQIQLVLKRLLESHDLDVDTAESAEAALEYLIDHRPDVAEQRRAVPIFVGGSEGHSIELRLTGAKPTRPLTHDLFDSALAELRARVHSARVVKLEGGVYFGVLVLLTDGRLRELDSRASDAVAMALGAGAPNDGGVPEPPKEPPHIAL